MPPQNVQKNQQEERAALLGLKPQIRTVEDLRCSPLARASTFLPFFSRLNQFEINISSTAITVDDNALNEVAQEEIFENIKLHKEVLSNVKMQPWNMRKKLRLVVQAKSYIKKHEGQLQERLAQSHSTKDMLARWNIVLIKVSVLSH